mgnify:CR=1 FL=1
MTMELQKPIVKNVGELIELLNDIPKNLPIAWVVDDENFPIETVLTECQIWDSTDMQPGIMVEENTEGEHESTRFVSLTMKPVCEYTDDPEIRYLIFADGVNQKDLRI